MFKTEALCPICNQRSDFYAADTYESCRDGLYSPTCPLKGCVTRERAVASVLFSIYDRTSFTRLRVHDVAPADRGMSYWLFLNAYAMVATGYFPNMPFGITVGELQNEDLEHQTFEDEEFDIVIHLDVMEHLFDPFQALREIYRTLKRNGVCIFTTPTYDGRMKSEQVAFLKGDSSVEIIGEPEYHGNPQDPAGSLVTWRYGYDLPKLIFERTGFNVEVRRWQSPAQAIMGPMTEVYILRRPMNG